MIIQSRRTDYRTPDVTVFETNAREVMCMSGATNSMTVDEEDNI